MTSVERIAEYGQLEQEADAINDNRPPDNWPKRGNIDFHQVSLFYYEGAPVALDNLNFCIKDKEKVCQQRYNVCYQEPTLSLKISFG